MKQFLRQPRVTRIRGPILQLHLWTGLFLALYLAVMCLSGSVLVFRNDLHEIFPPAPLGSGLPHPFGYRATTWLLDLHDNLLTGQTGRRTNAAGAVLVFLLTVTGAFVWWPGTGSWRRALVVDRRASWKRLNWTLHGALGVWVLLFLLMWTVSGFHLSFPLPLNAVAEWMASFDEANPFRDAGDYLLYWLSYAHFGRFGGRVPGCGPACGSFFKALWALIALAPVILAVTGITIWYTRVPRPRAAREGLARRGDTVSAP
ncbi:MAG: PepSY-associated TM helix domain-containing protein [Vicinamibacterales bacterium]